MQHHLSTIYIYYPRNSMCVSYPQIMFVMSLNTLKNRVTIWVAIKTPAKNLMNQLPMLQHHLHASNVEKPSTLVKNSKSIHT